MKKALALLGLAGSLALQVLIAVGVITLFAGLITFSLAGEGIAPQVFRCIVACSFALFVSWLLYIAAFIIFGAARATFGDLPVPRFRKDK